MSVLEKEFKKKPRVKRLRARDEKKEYKPGAALLCGKNDKFITLKSYRKL